MCAHISGHWSWRLLFTRQSAALQLSAFLAPTHVFFCRHPLVIITALMSHLLNYIAAVQLEWCLWNPRIPICLTHLALSFQLFFFPSAACTPLRLMMAIKQVAISVPLYTEAIRQSRCFTPSSFRYILHSWSQRSRWRSRRRHSYNQCRRRTEQLRRKERVLHLDQPFCFNEVSSWPYLDDKETVMLELARNSCVFLWMGGKVRDWEGLGFAV